MEYHNGSIFDANRVDSQLEPMAHCVSQDMRMGAGIALQFRNRFGIPEFTTTIGGFVIHENNYHLVTKRHYWNKPSYTSLQRAVEAMRDDASNKGITDIHMPRIGSGLDKLEWSRVEQMLQNVFEDSGIQIHIYVLGG